jgi:D-tyrosyl-tRNA(Tyr) deacylase
VRVVLQRVIAATVSVEGDVVSNIDRGLFALVGVGQTSTVADATWLAGKTADLRIFDDEAGRMNRSVREIGGAVLAVSQFTLYGDPRKGRRPSFAGAAEPGRARHLYDAYCAALPVKVQRGVFGSYMRICVEADGPVTILLEREGS